MHLGTKQLTMFPNITTELLTVFVYYPSKKKVIGQGEEPAP